MTENDVDNFRTTFYRKVKEFDLCDQISNTNYWGMYRHYKENKEEKGRRFTEYWKWKIRETTKKAKVWDIEIWDVY